MVVELTEKQILQKQLESAQAQKVILQNNYDVQMPNLTKRIADLTAKIAKLE